MSKWSAELADHHLKALDELHIRLSTIDCIRISVKAHTAKL